jgi:polyhomeotic-like protein 1
VCRTEHYNNIQKEENKKKAIEQNLTIKEPEKVSQQQSPSPKVENLDPNKSSAVTFASKATNKERPLKCLETLAQKAGITFDEKYENSLTMEKSQSPAQQVQQNAQQMPLQLLSEQFQALPQFQIQQYSTGTPTTIQVKQEYATQQQQGITAADLKQLQDHQNQHMQQMQIVQESPQSPHQNSQNALQQAVQAGQVPAEYLQQRVQVLQQPLQNTSYLQHMYSPLVMSGNLLTHNGLGQQQQIQLIAAGKPFQNQLTQQMLTTSGGKPVLTATGAQGFSSYTPITIPSSQSQTLLFSPVAVNGVISSQAQAQQQNQQNMLPTLQTQSTPTKNDGQKTIGGQKAMQKVGNQGGNQQQQQQQQNVSGNQQQNNQQQQQQQQCVQVSQQMPTTQLLSGQTMQFATPWQLPASMGVAPLWATNGIQPQTFQVSNPIFIRGTNPDGTPVLFQQSPQQTTQQTVQQQHNRKSFE